MRPLILMLSLTMAPSSLLGQQLHTFENGEAADAEKVNEILKPSTTLPAETVEQ